MGAEADAAAHRQRRGLADTGIAYEIVTYAGAPHSFFDRKYEEHARACEDAWRRTLDFLNPQVGV